jgi:hypothetical protein
LVAIDGFGRHPNLLHDLENVGPGFLDDVHGQNLGTLLEHLGKCLAMTELGPGYVPQIDGHAVSNRDHDVVDVFRGLVLAHRAYDVPALPLVEVATRKVVVLAIDGRSQLVHRDLTGGECRRVHDDLHLPLPSAVDIGSRNPGDPLESGFDVVVGVIEQGGDVAPEPVFSGKRTHGKPGRAQNRFLDVGWIRWDLVEPVGDPEQGRVEIGSGLEGERDRSATVGTRALHLDQAFQGLELLFLLIDDLALDFLGAGSGPDGLDVDLRVFHVGRELDGNPKQRDRPEENEKNNADRGGDRKPDRVLDDFHGSS